jgi:hypothetical protein
MTPVELVPAPAAEDGEAPFSIAFPATHARRAPGPRVAGGAK